MSGSHHDANSAAKPNNMHADQAAQQIWKDEYLFETDLHTIIRCGDNDDSTTKPRFHLAYMPMRNRGEILRLMLEESGCSYDLEIIGFRNWENRVPQL